jgi:hypothetical protein
MTGSDVNNAQPPVAKPDSAIDEQAFVIGAAMPDHVAHALEHGYVQAAARSTR